MVTRTQAIKAFLNASKSPRDLVDLYNSEMECQVYVVKGDNQVIKDREFRGKKYVAFQCNETGVIYKPFRIPWDSMNENAHYDDPPMKFDLAKFAEGVGLTGWNWSKKVSQWVGYDFDSIVNHKKGLSENELKQIYDSIHQLPYVTVRTSTTGSGFHIYVFLNDVPTKSHTEHQRLAKAILEKMSLDCGYNLQSKVDQMGQILWVWATKMTDNGLQLIKKGEPLKDIPLNWNNAISREKRKIRPDLIDDAELDDFNKLAERRLQTSLDDRHRKVIEELSKIEGYETYWNSDLGMLITHTLALKEVHTKLSLKGPFDTASTASSSKNCFAFPMEDGAWTVRRHGRGVTEASTWVQDAGGWTLCYLNRAPDFATGCKINGGVEDRDGSFAFVNARDAIKAARDMDVTIELPEDKMLRRARLSRHNRNGKLIVEVDNTPEDPAMSGWIKKAKVHQFMSTNEILGVDKIEIETTEEEIRHCVTPDGQDAGWYVKGFDRWIEEPRTNVLSVISAMGYTFKEREMEIGRLTTNYWTLLNEPFMPEYPGNRQWNRNGAQLRYEKKEDTENLQYPTWMKVLGHLGRGLDDAVQGNAWCQENGLLTGADYLKCWIASMIQYPRQSLPYLFFYGKENSGKTSFHESIELLFTKGVIRISTALENTSHFNAEVEGAVLGVIEELNLASRRNGMVINKIKDWVTSRMMSIHCKGQTPYMAVNYLHFVQTSNHIDNAPVFPGDTRIVVIPVFPITSEIPKNQLDEQLVAEAQDFTTELLSIEIPKADGRLRIPVLHTDAKDILADSNLTDIERFAKSDVFKIDGACVSVQDVWESFMSQYDVGGLTMHTFNKHFALYVGSTKGKYGSAKTVHWGNISLNPDEPKSDPYVVVNGFLKKGV